ncbi:MAG: hypothetical protein QW707_01455 [Candidatus Bathyarchaeia archaeon]
MRRYEEYVIKAKPKIDKFGPEIFFSGEEDYKTDVSMWFFLIKEPVLMEEKPHKHDFDIYLFFIGVENFFELPGEVEIALGEEQELYVLTEPCTVYIPKGLLHCPLHFKRVDKPILFIHLTMAPKYEREEGLTSKD